MKRRSNNRHWWAQRLLRRPGIADAVAEALVAHDHECYARLAALHVLEAAGYSEERFLRRWSEGGFDA